MAILLKAYFHVQCFRRSHSKLMMWNVDKERLRFDLIGPRLITQIPNEVGWKWESIMLSHLN